MSRPGAWSAAPLVLGIALALGGCMGGRASLLATAAPGGSRLQSAPDPLGEAGPVGPSRGYSSRAAMVGGLHLSGDLRTVASAAGLRASGGVSAALTPVLSAAARPALGLAVAPAPAASLGASVAAVSQPLNLGASAGVRAKTALKPAKDVAATAVVQTGLGAASVHLGH